MILGGVISLIVTREPTKDNLEFFVSAIVAFLSLALIARVLTEYHKEKRTINKLEINDDRDLKIELTNFDSLEQVVTKLDQLDVTLKRSYRRDGSRLSIDFWVGKNESKRKLLRQHSNKVWDSRDVKATFLKIKELKNSKLTKREKDIVDDVEFS